MIYILITVAIILMVIIAFNRLVRARQMVKEAWSGVDVQLKRRHDLIPNLLDIVKGYSDYERSVFENVANLRSGDVRQIAEAENTVSGQIKTLLAVAEAYPDLKASTNFMDLQKNLSLVEDDLQYARRYYNGTVRDYNIKVQSFPSNICAAVFGFRNEEFFEIEYATERNAPDVEFN